MAVALLDRGSRDDDLVTQSRQAALGLCGHEPFRACERLRGLDRQRRRPLVADKHEHIGLARVEHELERVVAVARCLGGVERRAAADDRDAALREAPAGRHLGQPFGLHGDGLPRQVSCHTALYTMTGMGVFERFELQNGLRVLTSPMPHAQSVSCVVMLAAGSRYETPETNGIAHFAEHMFFKGTERRPTARDIAGEIDSIGGEFNAFTGKEYTGY